MPRCLQTTYEVQNEVVSPRERQDETKQNRQIRAFQQRAVSRYTKQFGLTHPKVAGPFRPQCWESRRDCSRGACLRLTKQLFKRDRARLEGRVYSRHSMCAESQNQKQGRFLPEGAKKKAVCPAIGSHDPRKKGANLRHGRTLSEDLPLSKPRSTVPSPLYASVDASAIVCRLARHHRPYTNTRTSYEVRSM